MRWWGSVENHTHTRTHTRSIILMILTNGNMFIFFNSILKKSTFHYLLEHIVQNIVILLWHETVKHYIANNFFSSWMVFKRARISWLLKIDDPLTPPHLTVYVPGLCRTDLFGSRNRISVEVPHPKCQLVIISLVKSSSSVADAADGKVAAPPSVESDFGEMSSFLGFVDQFSPFVRCSPISRSAHWLID